jgi:hypothetical protein
MPAEFAGVLLLLAGKQNITLGVPLGSDQQGPALRHYQAFGDSGRNLLNSIEMHRDGTIYIAYTPATSPLWYDTNWANAYDGFTPFKAARKFANQRRDITTITVPNQLPVRKILDDQRTFAELEAWNRDPRNQMAFDKALPLDRVPASRWFKLSLPVGWRADEWLKLMQSSASIFWKLVPGEAPLLIKDSGAYAFHDVTAPEKGDPSTWSRPFTGPPEYQTILPSNHGGTENGQKKFLLDKPLHYPGNHYVSWPELKRLAQSNPTQARDILRWRGHPSKEDVTNRRIPWISAVAEGIVRNSYLSNDDYGGTHREPARNYWLGTPGPQYARHTDWFPADGPDQHCHNCLCNDWEIFISLDPEYRFLLLGDPQPPSERGIGNFGKDHFGTLETELEQWLVPVGYRPDPGDRIFLKGRWIVDCGHNDWAGELHPYEMFVSSYAQRRKDGQGEWIETVAKVVITGAWAGGTLAFDLWPPPRPSPSASLHFERGVGHYHELTITETPLPRDNPNHVRVNVVSTVPYEPLLTKNHTDVYYNITRRLALKYRLWFR